MSKFRIPGWKLTSKELPVENFTVDTLICDEKGIRNKQKLVLYKGKWFFTDKSMYVYYTPTHWRYS